MLATLYLWPLYGLNVIKWHLFDDFRDVALGRIEKQRIPTKRVGVGHFIGFKALLTMAFVVPMLMHRAWSCPLLLCPVTVAAS